MTVIEVLILVGIIWYTLYTHNFVHHDTVKVLRVIWVVYNNGALKLQVIDKRKKQIITIQNIVHTNYSY